MKMGGIEKLFMNTDAHNRRMIANCERLLDYASVHEGQKYLEVGCGMGALSKHMAAKRGLNVTGVDVDPDQIAHAQQKTKGGAKLRFMALDATELPFEDAEFDVVLSSGVMHHIREWPKAFEEIDRVLKPGGHFVYWDIVYSDWAARLGESGLGQKLAKRYGFPRQKCIEDFALGHGLKELYAQKPGATLLPIRRFEAVYRKDS